MLLKHRRLLLLSLAVILSVLFAEAIPHTAKIALFAFCLSLSATLLLLTWRHCALRTAALALLLSALAVFSSATLSARKEQLALCDGKTLPIAVTLTEVTVTEEGEISAIGRTHIPTDEGPVRARVRVKAPIEAAVGDVLFGKAQVTLTQEGSVSESHGIFASLCFDKAARVTGESTDIEVLLGKLRAEISGRIKEAMPGEDGALLSAMLLGQREGLSASFERDMARIGTSHILSVSGLHLAVLTAAIAFLLRRLRIGHRLRFVLLSLFALFFIVLTGFSASVMRAGFMFAIAAIPILLREERDSLSALFAAVALILTVTPYAASDVGLWLSALSTLGILLFFDRFRPALRRAKERGALRRFLFSSLFITLAAAVATLPITLLCFGELPLLSPIANLILSPLSQIALYLALFVAVLGSFTPVCAAASVVCEAIFTISRFLADIPRTMITLHGVYLIAPALIALGILLYFCLCPRRRFRLRVPLSLLLVLSLALALPLVKEAHTARTELRLSRYTDEQGDCLCLIDEGERVLIPLSAGSTLTLADRDALARLSGEADALLLPCYTEGCEARVGAFLCEGQIHELHLPRPATPREEDTFLEILTAAAEERVPVYPFTQLPLSLGNVRITQLLLTKDAKGRTHLLLSLSYRGREAVCYTGEALPGGYSPTAGSLFVGVGELTLSPAE